MLSSNSIPESVSLVTFTAFVAVVFKKIDRVVPENVKDALFILENYGYEAIMDDNLRESLEYLDSQNVVSFYWNYCNLFCLAPNGRFIATQTGVHNPDRSVYSGVTEYHENAQGWEFYKPWSGSEEDDRPIWLVVAELASKIDCLVAVVGNDIFSKPKMLKALNAFKANAGRYSHILSGGPYNDWIK